MFFFKALNRILHLLNMFKGFYFSFLGRHQLQPLRIDVRERPSRISGKWLLFIPLFFFMQINDAQAQVKYKYGFSIGTGLYAAEGFGTNISGAIRFNKYFDAGRHFVEGSVGLASIRSQVLNAIGNTQFFEHNSLISFEFLYGYDPKMWTSLPYFTIGVASIDQGGQSHFAGIVVAVSQSSTTTACIL